MDLFLIHWPGVKGKRVDDKNLATIRKDTWKALEYCLETGYTKCIGVSNYTQQHMVELLEYAQIEPMVLQTEFHPYLCQNKLLNFCQSKSIAFQAYSSLGSSDPMSSSLVMDNTDSG